MWSRYLSAGQDGAGAWFSSFTVPLRRGPLLLQPYGPYMGAWGQGPEGHTHP